jgi:hypothetical protein
MHYCVVDGKAVMMGGRSTLGFSFFWSGARGGERHEEEEEEEEKGLSGGGEARL